MTTSELHELLSYLTPHERDELDAILVGSTPPGILLDHIRDDPAQVMTQAGLIPDPWQADLLRSSWQEALLLCSRQVGKTTTSSALVLNQALLEPDSLVLILSPTQRQSCEMLQDKVCRMYDALGCPVPARRRQQKSLQLANGSRIIALPDNERGIRGYSAVKLLVIDEASRVPDELYFAARPALATSQGRLVALSTPFGRRGWFFQEWERSEGWKRVAVQAEQCSRLTPEFLAQELIRLGLRWFEQEYRLRFNDAVDQMFAASVIEAAMRGDVLPLFPGG